jgi:hypothetical protein
VFLDAGQAVIGSVTCAECGVHYHPGHAADEAVHARTHAAVCDGVAFKGWKDERVVMRFPRAQPPTSTPKSTSATASTLASSAVAHVVATTDCCDGDGDGDGAAVVVASAPATSDEAAASPAASIMTATPAASTAMAARKRKRRGAAAPVTLASMWRRQARSSTVDDDDDDDDGNRDDDDDDDDGYDESNNSGVLGGGDASKSSRARTQDRVLHVTSSDVGGGLRTRKIDEILGAVDAALAGCCSEDAHASLSSTYSLYIYISEGVVAAAATIDTSTSTSASSNSYLPSPAHTASSTSQSASSSLSTPPSSCHASLQWMHHDSYAETPSSSSSSSSSSSAVETAKQEDGLPPLPTPEFGVKKLYVHPRFRRRGIACRLVDAVRSSIIYAYTVPRSAVAFSQPTSQGLAFASRYGGRNDRLALAYI